MTTHIIPPGVNVQRTHDRHRERLPMWTVYRGPSDLPAKFAARLWLSLPEPEPTDVVIIGDTVADIHAALPDGVINIGR